MAFKWTEASDKERADMVRNHARMVWEVCPACGRRIGSRPDWRALTRNDLCELFQISDAELENILAGADYPSRQNV